MTWYQKELVAHHTTRIRTFFVLPNGAELDLYVVSTVKAEITDFGVTFDWLSSITERKYAKRYLEAIADAFGGYVRDTYLHKRLDPRCDLEQQVYRIVRSILSYTNEIARMKSEASPPRPLLAQTS